MAEREASVKLTLDDAEYIVSMRKAGDEAEKTGRKGQKAMGLFGTGIDGAKKSLQSLGDMAKKATGLVTGLAAGFSVGAALKGAIELDARFKTLAFRVQTATGEMTRAVDIQTIAEQAASRTGRTTAEMADAFDKVFSATKNLDFSVATLGAIGTTATATGESIETVATLAQQLQRKFGIAADDVGDSLAQIFEGAQQGGPAFADFASTLDVLGAELLQVGVTGKRGLGFLIGALNQADAESGGLGKQVAGLQQLFAKLGNPKTIEAMAKSMGISPKKLLNEKDALKRLDLFLKQGQKGLDTLRATFVGPDEAKALRILFTDPFEKALAEANASGKKGKAAIEQAISVLDAGIANFGKATINGADIQKQAAERMKDPQRRLELALEQLERSFASPEIIGAIEELAVHLPGLAKIFGDFVKFAAQNPLLAGALGVGASAAGGFAKQAGMQFLGDRAGQWGSLIKAQATVADNFGAKIGAAHKVGGMQVGNAIRGAGALAAIAIAGALAKEAIDQSFEEDAKTGGELAAAGASAASMTGGIKKQQADADRLRAAIRAKKESQSGVSGFTQDLFGGVASLVDENAPNLRAQNDAQIAEMEALLRKKEARIAELKAGGGTTPVAKAPDPKQQGKATADALKGGAPLRVEIVGGGVLRGGASGGGRGPRSPAPAQPGGGF